MNRSTLQTALLAAAAGLLLSGCGNDTSSDGGLPTVTPSTQSVIDAASVRSEDGEPFPINNGAFAFNDTFETTDPTAINR